MQQIGASIASISTIEERRLPVPQRKNGNRMVVAGRTVWVLHKRLFLRAMAAVACCALIAGAYEAREQIGLGVDIASEFAQAHIARSVFGVDQVKITGQTLTSESDILTAMGFEPNTSTLNFDLSAALKRINELPAVASATVRKVYPDQVVVSLVEKAPVARWRVDGVTFLVDASGEQIGEDGGAYSELPLVIGDGAADDAVVMIRALERYPDLSDKLVALSRIGDRRWDLIYESGLRVQLPETGVAQALGKLDAFQRDYQLLDRDVTLIDMRVENMVAVLPTKREEDGAGDKTKKPETSAGRAQL